MEFFNSAIGVLQTLVIALGAGIITGDLSLGTPDMMDDLHA